MFTNEDFSQMKEHGVERHDAEEQIRNFKKGFPFLDIVKPASTHDGVVLLDEKQTADI